MYHSVYTENKMILESKAYHFVKVDLFGNGNLGVNFFFVLSGFLITFLMIKEVERNQKVAIFKFWMRRILRIWPLYFVCVFFGFVVFPLLDGFAALKELNLTSLVSYLTFLNNFDVIFNGEQNYAILSVLWSVAVEEQFYFVLPLMMYFVPYKRLWILFSLLIVMSLIFRGYYDFEIYHEKHTISCFGDLAVGCLGAFLLTKFKEIENKLKIIKRSYIILIYMFLLLMYFIKDELYDSSFLFRIFERLIFSAIFLFVILEQCYSKNSFYKMSNFKLVTNLGKMTYGLYCLHFVGILFAIYFSKFFNFSDSFFNVFITQLILALTASIFISWLSYKFFETPFLRLKNKYN